MDDKRRSKRAKQTHEDLWECSLCTYRNSAAAFKCEMCDARKGTSTRKPKVPRLDSQLVAEQAIHLQSQPPRKESNNKRSDLDRSVMDSDSISSVISMVAAGAEDSISPPPPVAPPPEKKRKKHSNKRLRNIDRSSGVSINVTCGNVTVVITDYKPKPPKLDSHRVCATTNVSEPPSRNSDDAMVASPNNNSSCSTIVDGGSHSALSTPES